MDASDIVHELKTFYKDGVHYYDLDRHLKYASYLQSAISLALCGPRGESKRKLMRRQHVEKAQYEQEK